MKMIVFMNWNRKLIVLHNGYCESPFFLNCGTKTSQLIPVQMASNEMDERPRDRPLGELDLAGKSIVSQGKNGARLSAIEDPL